MTARPRIVIVGCGFGGLETARALAGAEVDITLVDRTNHHLFQPLLYQVATAGLSAPAIAAPARHLFRRQANVTTLLGEVVGIDAAAREVRLREGASLTYDHLVVAAGATHSYFGRDDWAPFAPGLKTLDDAFEIRRRILL
ncbi:MAG TPA: FAD-dependent oxidoreductase, partial [Ramlibacter sp.]